MKHSGLHMIGLTSLLGIILTAGAQTVLDPEDCMGFTSISIYDIEISWDRSCFNNDTLYQINMSGDGSCNKDGFKCEESPCHVNIAGMGCGSNPIIPCASFTYTITGSETGNSYSLSTHAAPIITPGDWQLENSTITEANLTARWGPVKTPLDPFVACADRTKVAVLCTSYSESSLLLEISDIADIVPGEQGVLELQIDRCEGGNIIITATYMSGDAETDAKGETMKDYDAPTTPATSTTTTSATTTTIPIILTSITPATSTTTTTATTTTIPIIPRDGLSGGEIAGIVIAVIAVVVIIGAVVYCYTQKKLCFDH